MKKVLFAITNLEMGGAEKVLVDLVNVLKDTYDITVLTLYGNGCLAKNIDKKVKVQTIFDNSYESMSFFQKKLCVLQVKVPFLRRRLYQKYVDQQNDVEIAFLEGPMTELLQEKSSSKKIAWIHTDLEEHYKKEKYKKLLQVYQNYQDLVFVSQNSLGKFNKIDALHCYQGRKQIIYNYMNFESIVSLSKEKITDVFSNDIHFVVVARLVPAKGIDRLMRVHQKLLKDGFTFHIYVVGDGPLRNELEQLQKELQIEDTFHFLGRKMNPYPYMKKATCFLLPSIYEGYPVTLMEAMSLNQYVIATDIAGSEVLENYPNKIIVENSEDGIYNGLKSFLLKPQKCKKSENVIGNKDILDQIKKLIEEEVK